MNGYTYAVYVDGKFVSRHRYRDQALVSRNDTCRKAGIDWAHIMASDRWAIRENERGTQRDGRAA